MQFTNGGMSAKEIREILDNWLQNYPTQEELNDTIREWQLINKWIAPGFRWMIDEKIARIQSGIDRQNF